MTTHKLLGNSLLISIFAALTACGGGSSSSSSDTSSQSVTIPFQAKSGATEINCDAELLQLGTTADSATIASFAYYVHDVKLVTADGTFDFDLDANDFQDPENGVALLDYQDKNSFCTGAAKPTNKQLSGTVSGDLSEVTGIEFKVGIPAAINHRDSSTNVSPYNVTNMAWSWNSGHKFMRLDIKPSAEVTTPTSTVSTRNFHLGSTGCTGDAVAGEVVTCSSNNQVPVSLSGFSVADGQADSVVLDFAELLVGSDINNDNGGPVGCMSFPGDPECPVMFEKLGMPYAGIPAVDSQTIFSVE